MTSAWDLFTAGFLPAFQQSGAEYRADQRHADEMQFRQQGFDLQKEAGPDLRRGRTVRPKAVRPKEGGRSASTP